MKKDLMDTLVPMKKEDLQQLCSEIKETIAKDVVIHETAKAKETSFGAGDLWSLQRKMRLVRGLNRSLFIRG